MKRTQATTVALLVTMIGAACTKTDSTADSKKTKTESELTTDSGTSSDPNKNVVATVGKTKITEAQALADYAILAKLSNAASAGQAGAKKLDPKKPTHELLLSTVSQLATAEALKLSLKTRKGSITAKDRADAVKQLDSQLAQSPGVKLPADYKKRLLEQYAIETAVLRTFKLDDVSLQAEYKKNPPKAVTCAHHLLVDTEAEATEALKSISGGAKFEDVAKLVSKDTGSGQQGGDLGCADTSGYVPEFAAALDALKPGETSKPVKTEYGYHVIRRDADKTPTFEESRDQMAQERLPAVKKEVLGTIHYAKGFDPTAPSSSPASSPTSG